MRRLVLAIAAIVSLAASFGGPEEVDPKAAPETLGYGTISQLGVDGSGRAYWFTERLPEGDARVLERCDGGWQPALIVPDALMVQDLAVAPSGAAVAVWVAGGQDELYAAYRSPAGAWGAPQQLPTSEQIDHADVAIDASGDAVLAWENMQSHTVSATYRPAATGAWDAPKELPGGFLNPRVAILGGTALVTAADAKLVQDKILAFPRPWGGAPETVVDHNGNMRGGGWLEIDPVSGRAMVIYSEGPIVGRTLKAVVRNGGAWTATGDLEGPLPNGSLLPQALARHQQGLAAVWRSGPAAEMKVRRWTGNGWDATQSYAGPYDDVTAAANGDGEIVVAGSKQGEIWGATAQGIGGAWSAATRLSAAAPGWRFPLAAGGGSRLVVAWGDHTGGPQRTLAAVSGACAASPSPTPTATPTPTPVPSPPPPPGPQPRAKKPVKLADVVALPSEKRCAKSIKLKFRKPAKSVALTVNGKKVKVKIGKAVTVKLRKRTTLKLTVTLTDGAKLKATRRYKPC